MEWLELKGSGLATLAEIAKRDGLRHPLVIVTPLPTEENRQEHSRRCGNWVTHALRTTE